MMFRVMVIFCNVSKYFFRLTTKFELETRHNFFPLSFLSFCFLEVEPRFSLSFPRLSREDVFSNDP
ncbi:unnamed protein product, partial [Amoebophrya sp. A120]|eukprot:GSA120T00004190001.1